MAICNFLPVRRELAQHHAQAAKRFVFCHVGLQRELRFTHQGSGNEIGVKTVAVPGNILAALALNREKPGFQNLSQMRHAVDWPINLEIRVIRR